MRRIVAVMAAVLVSATCLAASNAAPTVTPKGLQNAKKVMQHDKERYQRVREVKKQAHVRKEHARTERKQ